MTLFILGGLMPRNNPSMADSRRDGVAGLVLAAGAAALFLGTVFYVRLTPQLGLPAMPAERNQALADALAFGPQRLFLAGGWAFLGDCLLLAACIVLAGRRRHSNELASAGWSLMAVSAALAMIFDSMTAALFWPLAHGSDSGPFLALKAWFDFLFAAADVPFGLGCIAVLWVDIHSEARLLAKGFSYCALAVCAAAAASGLGYVVDLFHFPLVIGLTVTLGCIVLAALGVQIARREWHSAATEEAHETVYGGL
jgi:hypothetical protein